MKKIHYPLYRQKRARHVSEKNLRTYVIRNVHISCARESIDRSGHILEAHYDIVKTSGFSELGVWNILENVSLIKVKMVFG